MPKLDMEKVRELIRTDRRYRGNVRRVAEATGIPYGSLRNALGSGDQMRYERVSLLADALAVKVESIVEATGIPSPPPEQPKGPKGPPPARKKKDGTGDTTRPKVDDMRAAS